MFLEDMLADEILGQAYAIWNTLLGLTLCASHHWSLWAKDPACTARASSGRFLPHAVLMLPMTWPQCGLSHPWGGRSMLQAIEPPATEVHHTSGRGHS